MSTAQALKPEPKPIPPGSLENKFFIMNRAPLDRRMKRKHLAVLGFILDWYHSKYGDALASVRHIVAELKERDIDGIGLYAGDVHAALADLVAWNYLSLEKGTGRRASRYTPIWTARSVREFTNANDNNRSVLISPNACVLVSPNATDVCVRDSMNEDPSTPTRAQDPGTERLDIDFSPPTAPPGSASGGPTGADGHKEEKQQLFDELWKAYGHRQKRADARAAYDKAGPDADLHRTMVEAATAWRVHWERQGNPDAPRKSLASWIRTEGFLEDPPIAYKPKEPKPTPVASNDNQSLPAEWDVGVFSPFGTFTGEIVDYRAGKGFEVIVGIDISGRGSADIEHKIDGYKPRGQSFIAQLYDIAGVRPDGDSCDIVGTRVQFTISDRGHITYQRAA